MNITNLIPYLLKQSGWTQRELAKHLGIKPSTIFSYLRANNTRVKTLYNIADGFGYDIYLVPKRAKVPPSAIKIDDMGDTE